jgi:hypothetical protein
MRNSESWVAKLGFINMMYENRIKLLSRALRYNLRSHSDLIQCILDSIPRLDHQAGDGGVLIDSFEYDEEHEEIIFQSRGGPATRIAKMISEMHISTKVRIYWQSVNFKSGKAIYLSGLVVD